MKVVIGLIVAVVIAFVAGATIQEYSMRKAQKVQQAKDDALLKEYVAEKDKLGSTNNQLGVELVKTQQRAHKAQQRIKRTRELLDEMSKLFEDEPDNAGVQALLRHANGW